MAGMTVSKCSWSTLRTSPPSDIFITATNRFLMSCGKNRKVGNNQKCDKVLDVVENKMATAAADDGSSMRIWFSIKIITSCLSICLFLLVEEL